MVLRDYLKYKPKVKKEGKISQKWLKVVEAL
jgi:hypothetical protein